MISLKGLKPVFYVFLILFGFACSTSDEVAENSLEEEDELPIFVEPELFYGFNLNEYDFDEGKVKNNEFLANILLRYGVDYGTIDKMITNGKEIFDPRNLVAGKKFVVAKALDSLKTPQYFIYEKNSIEFVVFQLVEPFQVYLEQKEVEVIEREASGLITSSLYQTLVDNDLSPALAVELANIYAWTIDFYRIQKNDAFKVIFEEKRVDGERVGIGKINAAWFKNVNTDYYAVYFNQDEYDDYFDEEGKSLRKAFLKAPLKFSRISSRYNKKRFHPVLKQVKAHLGTDYAAPAGTPILAVGDGTVTEATFSKYNGNYVKIKHNSTYTTQYLHMSKFAKGIKSGVRVKQGEVIGYVGSTGLATGPHVCFRFWKNGEQVDHLREKFPSADPIKSSMIDAYQVVFNEFKTKLDSIEIIDKSLVAQLNS
jgi:murein DD-endopeptidase MepM/ murein hydrolase activator NlpD